MRSVTEIRHEGLPKQRPDLIQAKVQVYTASVVIERHCFRTLRCARDFIANLRRHSGFRQLHPEDHANPPDGTYLVWIRPGATTE